MTHAQMQEALISVDDPELPASQRDALLAHAAACGECALVLRQWRSASSALARASGLTASETFVADVMRRLPERGGPGAAPSRWTVPAWLIPRLGVALAVAVLAVLLWHREPSLSTETLLLASAPEGSAWEFSSDTPDAALLLDLTTESP